MAAQPAGGRKKGRSHTPVRLAMLHDVNTPASPVRQPHFDGNYWQRRANERVQVVGASVLRSRAGGRGQCGGIFGSDTGGRAGDVSS